MFSGVTPAQQEASTVISVSGKALLNISAFDTTHMSEHNPTISIEVFILFLIQWDITSTRPLSANVFFST